jgi:hypothetical protein
MGRRGREMAEQEFSERKVVDTTLILYRNLIGEPGAEIESRDKEKVLQTGGVA